MEATDLADWWLETFGPDNASLRGRGKSIARKGSVERFVIEPGRVAGRVRHGRGRPPQIEVEIPLLDDDEWDRLVDEMAGQVRYTAALLNGELPDDLDELAAEAGIDLLPTPDTTALTATCFDDQPCLHVIALHAAVADALRDDPSLLLRIRGKDRDALLDALRSARSDVEEEVPSVLEGIEDAFAARGDLDAVIVQPTPVDDPASLFQHLGAPPGVEDTEPFEELIARTADTAWKLASGAGSEAADEELLLAELRAQRFGSAASVADALGWDEQQTREALDELFEEGEVLRTGTGEGAKYRAASSG